MATALEISMYPHIVKSDGVRGGKGRIGGTRICVKDLVHLHKWGKRPEEIREYYSDRPRTLAEVHSALAYYYDHVEEIDAKIAAEQGRHDRQERAKTDAADSGQRRISAHRAAASGAGRSEVRKLQNRRNAKPLRKRKRGRAGYGVRHPLA